MLPLHDEVRVVFQASTGETDAHGEPITTSVDVTVPAEVQSLGSSTLDDLGKLGRYKMILAPTFAIPPTGWISMQLHWRSFNGVDNSTLTVDGTIDHITVRGHLHHYELTTKVVTT